MYNAHFKFREAPFCVTPDPRFYYANAVYQEAWATLRYGIEARKGFIVITGEAGTGKTTLLRKAMHAFGSNIKTAYISNTLVGRTDLLRLMLTELGLAGSTEDRSAMIERFTHYLIEQFEKGNIVALLIDEAQNLTLETLEELRCLGNLETDKDKLLQIVLVGHPELEQKLDQPELRQLKQRVVLRCRLKPIASDEVESYMDSRLQIIGHRSEDLFDPNAVEKIAFYSTGIPRLINITCDNALLTAYALSARKVSAAMIDEVAEDLHLGQSRMEQKVRAQALISPFEEKGTFESVPAQEDDLTTKEEPLFNDSNDRPLSMHKESISSDRASRHWFRPIIGTGAAIVLLTGLGVSLYSHEWRFSVSGSHSDIAPRLDSGPKEMNQVDLAASAVGAKTSTIIPQPTLPATQIQPLSLTDQNASRARLEEATHVSTGEEITTAQQASTGPIASDVKKSQRPLRGDKQKPASNSADLRVIGASFVRSRPTANAEIIATLGPGTRIQVTGPTGEYYGVRSLGTKTIRGYVHKEDAFFERKR
jgi:general secretion pathway protein A